MTTTTTLEIINGISQVLSNTYDGALDDKGEPIKVGLRREEGNPLLDQRILDGFSASISGNSLHIKYHCEPMLKEVHSSSFESETEQIVEKVKKYITKEYKKVTGNSLSLTDSSEIQVVVEYLSRVRTIVRAHKCWKISGVKDHNKQEKDAVSDATRSWLESAKSPKKAKNDTRKS